MTINPVFFAAPSDAPIRPIFRPRSSAIALEPRVLFDAAAAVAVDDHLADRQTTANYADAAEKTTTPAVDATPSTPSATAAPVTPTTLLVVDTRVADYQSLLADLPGNVIVRLIQADESGFDAITQAIDGAKGSNAIESIQILSHGSSGSITLGRDTLNSAALSSHSVQVQSWASHLSANADILLYGCDVAAGPDGTALLTQLAALTSADIAASTDDTGSAAKGGNWVLEQQTGQIESRLVVSEVALARYDGLLVATTNVVPGAQTIAEDNTLTFAGTISVTTTATNVNAQVSIAHGALTLSGTTGLAFTVGDGTSDETMTFSGTKANVNAALNGLVYRPAANYSGADTLTIISNDTATPGVTDTDTVGITVNPNATAPVLTLPTTSQMVPEDVASYLNFTATNPIVLTDADANDLQTLTLTVAHGTLNIKTDVAGGITSATNNGMASVILSGTAAQLSATLADAQGIRYTSVLNYNSSAGLGAEALNFSLSDGVVAHDKTGSVSLNVTPVNDAPTFSGAVPASVLEGGSVGFTRAQLASSDNALDVDIQTGQQVIGQLMVKIDSLPVHGALSYNGGAVVVGSVVPVTNLGNLVFTHDGTDILIDQTISFNVTVSDGGGDSTAGSLSVTVHPKNVAPTISGSPTLIEGQVKEVSPTINLGDSFDILANSTIVIDTLVTGSQGTFFIDANNNNVVDAGEALAGSTTLGATQRANLATQLKFSQNGYEPNTPGATSPSYCITVTDAGGGTGVPSAAIQQTITLSILPNNDDPTLVNTHATVGTALTAQEGAITPITAAMLQISDADLNPADTTHTTPDYQLVYTIGTRPTQGEIQVNIGGGLGYGGDGWITLGDGGRFTQAQVTAGQVRYYQTANVADGSTTPDNFMFTVRDSAYGYDVWTDPANPTSNREGGLRATPTGAIATQPFYLDITPLATPVTPRVNTYEGPPRPASSGFGGSDMTYTFVPTGGMLNHNTTTAGTWDEANVGSGGAGYVITSGMLSYTITRTDTKGTPDTADDVSVTVPPNETVYTLSAQPGNGILQSHVSGSWQAIPTNGQFTQADINAGNIRFVDDGSENHTSSFSYTVSDGTPNHYSSTFGLDITPTNDRPTGSGGSVQVLEKTPGNDGLVRLDGAALGMSDIDLSQDVAKQTGEGAQDFLWFTIVAQPADGGATPRGELQRWTGAIWVAVTPGQWLPSTLLSVAADGGTSGLRYAHDGSEPLAYTGGPNLTFHYLVRDDLANPGDSLATNASAVADSSGSVQSNQSADATTTIRIIPVNNAPVIADKPGDVDPTIGSTIAGGGVLTGVNEVLTNVPEGGTATITSAFLSAIDSDNTTVQRQYHLTSLPTLGVVLLSGKTLGVGSTFTQDDIDNNRVSYRHNGAEVVAATTDGLGTYNDKFSFVVSDAVSDDTGTNAPNYNTFLITLTPTNDAPTVTGPSGIIEIDSSTAANNLVSGFVVADPDLTDGVHAGETDFVQATVRLLDSSGNPITNYSGFAGGGVSIGYTTPGDTSGFWAVTKTGTNDILQLQGTRAQVNAALAGLSVTFANDANSMYKVQVIVDDRMRDAGGALYASGNDANGGELNQATTAGGAPTAVPATVYDWAANTAVPANDPDIAAASVDIRASLVNEIPTFTGPGARTVYEDVRTQIPANSFAIADPESAAFNTPVTVTLSIPSGQGTLDVAGQGTTQTSFTPSGGQAITIVGDQTNSITLTGRASDIQALLNQRNLADTTADASGGLFYTGPANGNHDYNAGSAGDVTLTLSMNDSGSRFGSDVGSGSVAANPADITIPITITPVNDAPTVAATGSPLAISGLTAVSGFVISDVDNTDGGALNATIGETDFVQVTVRLLPAAGTTPLPASGDAGGIDHTNVVLSSSTPGTATVDATYTGNGKALVIRGTLAEVNSYLAGLQVSLSGSLLNDNATYRVQVLADDRIRDAAGTLDGSNAANGGLDSDGGSGTANVPVTAADPYAAIPGGLTNNVASNTRTILGSNINEAPSFALLDNAPIFAENGAAVVLDSNATLGDPELSAYSNWNGAALTLARNGGANADDVFGLTGSGSTGINFNAANIRNGSTVVGIFSNVGGTLSITFNSSADNTVVNSVLQAITYSNSNDNPPGSVVIGYTINDGDTDPVDRAGNGQGTGGPLTGAGSITVGITPTNDNPSLVGVTAKSYTEDNAAVVIGTGATPGDPELTLFAGNTGNWGNARLTISRNGGNNAEDSFSNSGTLSALTQGGALTDGGTAIGTVSANSAGTLTITFAENVTTAQVQGAIRQIAYSNSRQTLGAGASASVTLNWLLEDGDTDADRATNPQGAGGNKTVTVAQTITLNGINDTPVANADVAAAIEAGGLNNGTAGSNATSNVLTNDTDVDSGDTKTVSVGTGVRTGTYGTLTLNADGSYTYVVDETNAAVQALRVTGQTVSEVFAYTMRDTAGATSASTLTVTIDGRNDTPVANADVAAAIEAGGLNNGTAGSNATGNVLTNDTDVDTVANGETKTVSVGTGVRTGTYGTLTLNADGSYTYVVDDANAAVQALQSGQTVSEVFAYTMRDTAGNTSASTLTVTINGRNDNPVAVNDGVLVTPEDTPLINIPILANDTDLEHDTLSVTSATIPPAQGSVSINPDGTLNYTPALNFNGTAIITYAISDGHGGTASATVTINVGAVNDPPVAVDDSGHSPDGRPVTVKITDNDSDPEGDALTITKIAGVAVVPGNTVTIPAGIVTLSAGGTVTFAPNPGVQGSVVFPYEISDGHGGTATANVTITVTPAGVIFSTATPSVLSTLHSTDVAREPSVFFDGDTYNGIIRLPIPLHPIVFVNNVVEHSQQERLTTDPLAFSDPRAVQYGEIQSQSIGATLGMDAALFVQHAVRAAQSEGAFLDKLVDGRLTRINLSSDRLLATPDLSQPNAGQNTPRALFAEIIAEPERSAVADVAQQTVAAQALPRVPGETRVPAYRSAPSFSEQLRGAGRRVPVANRDTNHSLRIRSNT